MSTQLIQSGGFLQTTDLAQVVYLDFDGEAAAYNGEILTVDDVEVQNSNLTQDRIQQITAALNEQFATQNVQFVQERPASGEYSTIYIGKTSSFEPYGHFAGLAETVDSGNQKKNDNAFVMLDALSSNEQIVNVIAHETSHLLGTLDHGGSGLQKYAYHQRYDVTSGVISSGISLRWDSMYVSKGGMATKTFVNSDGWMYICGGSAINTSIDYDGKLVVLSGGVTLTIVNSDGWMGVYGGSAIQTYIYDGTMNVYSGGTATSTTVYRGGEMGVSSGGTTTSTTVNYDGYLNVSSGGTAAKTTVNSGGYLNVYNGTAIQNYIYDGTLNVSSGGTATSTTVYSGGYLNVSSDGAAANTTVNSNGYLNVSNGGTAANTTVNSGGWQFVSCGGTAANTTVNSGGWLWVYSNGRISGGLQIASDAFVTAYYGASIDFTVAEQTTPATALINNWSLITGRANVNYTITVKTAQASGSYILADGAEEFAQTITLKDTFNTTLGTLVVGETQKFNGVSYTLAKNGGELSLTIVSKVAASTKSDLDGNGISDVMFQYTGGDYQIGFWMNGSSTWQATGVAQPDNWVLLGNYDMDANGKADQVMFGNVLGGAYIGYYKDGDTTSNGWQNIGYLNNPTGIFWQNAVGNLTGNAGKNSIVWHAPGLGALGVWTDGTDNWVSLAGGFDSKWVLQGCGDFNDDGRDEILFANAGNLYTTDIDGNFASLGGWGPAWEVRAIGDFSGDGKDDIVLFHEETGSVVKFADGLAENWSSLGQLDASDWFIVGAGDYNNDRKDDLLVRQYSTGMLGYYSAGDMSQWNEMGRGVDMNWTVIA